MPKQSPRNFWISSIASPATLRAKALCLPSLVSHQRRKGLADHYARQLWDVLYPLHHGADGGVKLTESNVVSEYLDNAYPGSGPKMFPTDPTKLALVRFGRSSSQCMSRAYSHNTGIILMLLLDLQVRLFAETFGAASGSISVRGCCLTMLGAQTKAELDAAKEGFTKALKVSLCCSLFRAWLRMKKGLLLTN